MTPAPSGPTRRPKPRTLAEWFDGPPVLVQGQLLPRSQRVLGKLVHVHQSMISMILRGERTPSVKTARRLEKVTGIPLDVLVPPLPPDDDNDA